MAGVDEAGEAVDVAAEAGAIVQQAVKPSEVGVDELDDVADIEHGEERSGADYGPRP